MSDNAKRSQIHKQAVLEFLYATAAQSLGHVALAMVEANGDYDGAQSVLDNPLTRAGFAENVSKELRKACGDVTIQDATVVVLEVGGPTQPPGAAKGSSDFGAN